MASSIDMTPPGTASEGTFSDSDDDSSSVTFRLQSNNIDQHLPSRNMRNGAKSFERQESMNIREEQVQDTMTGHEDIYGGFNFDLSPRRDQSIMADVKSEEPSMINGQEFARRLAGVPASGPSMINDVISPTSRRKRAREEGHTAEFASKRRGQRENGVRDSSEDSAFDKFIIPSDATIIDLTYSPPSSSNAAPDTGSPSQMDAFGELDRPEVALPCVSCGDDFDVTRLAHMGCEHDYCQECLQTMVTNALQDEDLYPPKCCKKPFEMDDMRMLLSPELISGFHEKKLEFETANRIYCSNATCSTFLYPVNIKGDSAQCPICEAQTCTICKGPEHDGDCPQDSAVQEVLEMANGQGWRRCPQCKAIVELGTGCNHITCRCKAQWCYLCGAAWRTCQCPQYTPGRLDGAFNLAGAELNEAIQLIADLRNRMNNLQRREPGQGPPTNGAGEGVVGIDEQIEAAGRAAGRVAAMRDLRAGMDRLRRQADQNLVRALADRGDPGAAEQRAELNARMRDEMRARYMQIRFLEENPPAGIEQAAEPVAGQAAEVRARLIFRRPAVPDEPAQLPPANAAEAEGTLEQTVARLRESTAAIDRAAERTRQAQARLQQRRQQVELNRTHNDLAELRDRMRQQRVIADRHLLTLRAQVQQQRDDTERQLAELTARAQQPVPEAPSRARNPGVQPLPLVQGQPQANPPRSIGFAELRARVRRQQEILTRPQAEIAIVGAENLSNRLTAGQEPPERPESQAREVSQFRMRAPTHERSHSLERFLRTRLMAGREPPELPGSQSQARELTQLRAPAPARERSGSPERLRDPVRSPHRRLAEHRLRWTERRNLERTRSLEGAAQSRSREHRQSVSPVARPRQRYDPPSP